MHYIRELFRGEAKEWVHDLFTRYGRGEYVGPVCEVEVKKSVKFKGSVEYCNIFGLLAASSGGDYEVSGSLFAKQDFRDVLKELFIDFDDKSKVKKSYFVADMKDTIPGEVLVQLYEKLPYATILLSLKGSGKIKCKKKPPKPGKEKAVDFCSGQLDLSVLERLREEVFFDVSGGFKEAKVENTFVIDELVIPEGVSAAEARLQAKRKGKVRRKVTVDGQEMESECELLA
ncbi:MAG: hypothetical protein GF416_01000 [Candidatus Altiarchaeales archaeon]|nr:hypothetical protein [Candidatus Altiarchaeales archaeon]MBD3415694.1 hypothetical protein [Candidatus Altiarchaeales archaeon]